MPCSGPSCTGPLGFATLCSWTSITHSPAWLKPGPGSRSSFSPPGTSLGGVVDSRVPWDGAVAWSPYIRASGHDTVMTMPIGGG
jgi:hypothetical protein